MNGQQREDYQSRVVKHSLAWVNGKSEHNFVDNECLIDFSCCFPDCFVKDLEVRMALHKKLLIKLNKGGS